MAFTKIGILAQLKMILCLFSILLITNSCEEPQKIPTKRRSSYFNGGLNVRVIHPILGTGPNYIVRLYMSPEDSIAGLAQYSSKTGIDGIARFKNIRLGECYAECIVPGVKNYCANAYTTFIGDTNKVFDLKLRTGDCEETIMKSKN